MIYRVDLLKAEDAPFSNELDELSLGKFFERREHLSNKFNSHFLCIGHMFKDLMRSKATNELFERGLKVDKQVLCSNVMHWDYLQKTLDGIFHISPMGKGCDKYEYFFK
jgi:hypothetical protein